jgi:hypothetical protein
MAAKVWKLAPIKVLLNRIIAVEVCDATGVDAMVKAGIKK